ncbi:MAG TPA: hypothetical protein VJ770_30175 [Stellaceae bacterium]|nr:hypothetical protein [Stellaceae bacterium]
MSKKVFMAAKTRTDICSGLLGRLLPADYNGARSLRVNRPAHGGPARARPAARRPRRAPRGGADAKDTNFGFPVPESCPEIPNEVLDLRRVGAACTPSTDTIFRGFGIILCPMCL